MGRVSARADTMTAQTTIPNKTPKKAPTTNPSTKGELGGSGAERSRTTSRRIGTDQRFAREVGDRSLATRATRASRLDEVAGFRFRCRQRKERLGFFSRPERAELRAVVPASHPETTVVRLNVAATPRSAVEPYAGLAKLGAAQRRAGIVDEGVRLGVVRSVDVGEPRDPRRLRIAVEDDVESDGAERRQRRHGDTVNVAV